MIDTQGIVVSVSEGKIVVDIPDQRQSACGGCAMLATCGQKPTGRLKRYRFKKPEDLNVTAGDTVIIRAEEQVFKTGILYVYCLPTLFAIIGILIAGTMLPEHPYRDLTMGIGALMGIAFGFLLATWKNRLHQPEIIRACTVSTVSLEQLRS